MCPRYGWSFWHKLIPGGGKKKPSRPTFPLPSQPPVGDDRSQQIATAVLCHLSITIALGQYWCGVDLYLQIFPWIWQLQHRSFPFSMQITAYNPTGHWLHVISCVYRLFMMWVWHTFSEAAAPMNVRATFNTLLSLPSSLRERERYNLTQSICKDRWIPSRITLQSARRDCLSTELVTPHWL